MKRAEVEKFEHLWISVENCITLIDPHVDLAYKRLYKDNIDDAQDLVNLLTVYIKYLMLDNEAYRRERDTLTKMLMEQSDE